MQMRRRGQPLAPAQASGSGGEPPDKPPRPH
jgi:hypothetical protein